MSSQYVDAGSQSVSSKFMDLVNIHHAMDWSDFDDIVKFLENHMDDVINDVHKLDKLCLDDGRVSRCFLFVRIFKYIFTTSWLE